MTSEWNVQLRATPAAGVLKGDVCLARFWARCTDSMRGEGFVTFVFETFFPDYDKAAEVRLAVGTEWQELFVPFRAARDFPPEITQICFRVGYDLQTIEIGGIEITNFGKGGVRVDELPRTTVTYEGRSPKSSWRREAESRIEQFRKADLEVAVVDRSGKPVSGATVEAKLKRHAFGFGSCVTVDNLLDESPDGQQYRSIVEKHFNRAVFENDMKWQASYDGATPQLDRAVDWLLERHIKVRGHNLVWPSNRWLPKQLDAFKGDAARLRQVTADHIGSFTSHFRGKLFQWDVVNEPYSCFDLIDALGGRDILVDWFKLAHEADPDCKLYLNDFGILESGPDGAHSQHFYETIRFLIDRGAPIHGVGIQSHFAAALPSPDQLLQTLDRFGEFGLPIELTELSLNSDDRELQADYLRDFMTTAFAHPSVQGIMLWGFWEKRHWRPMGALYDETWSLRPHGRQWLSMIHEQWTTNATTRSDDSGVARVRGYLGEYEVAVSVGGGGREKSVVSTELPKQGQRLTITME